MLEEIPKCPDDDHRSMQFPQDEPVGDSDESHRSHNCSLMTLFFLGGCGVGLSVLPIMVSCKDHSYAYVNHINNMSVAVRSTFVGVVTLLLAFALFRMKRWIVDGYIIVSSGSVSSSNATNDADVPEQAPATDNEVLEPEHPVINQPYQSNTDQRPFPYAVVGFGLGGALYLISESAKAFYLRHVKLDISLTTYFDTFSDGFSAAVDLLYITSVAIQIAFFVKFMDVIPRSCAFFHFFIAVMIGGELWVWFSLTMNPIYELTENCNSSTSTHNNSSNGTTHDPHYDSIYAVLDNAGNFLKPFLVEFSTICIGILFNLWNKMEKTQTEEQKFNYDKNQNFDQPKNVTGRKKLITNGLVIAGSMLISVAYVLVFITLSGHFIPTNNTTSVFVWNCFHCALHVPMLAFLIPTCKKMKRHKIRLSLTSLTCSELFLISTNTVNYIYFFFRLSACLSLLSFAEQPDTAKLVFLSCFSCLASLDSWLETYYLLGMGCLQRSGVTLSNYDKYGLVYNGALHIAGWALTCLSHEWASNNPDYLLPELTTAFSDFSTRMVIFIVYPLLEFFYFHSSIIAFEVAKNI